MRWLNGYTRSKRRIGAIKTKKYTAPWGTSVVAISTLSTLLCVGLAIWIESSRGPRWAVLLPIGIICGSALFAVRGYTIAPDALLVHRLFWTTQVSLAGLRLAQFQPNAIRGSIRTFGIGGLFSFTGRFRNRALGSYRAFITDPRCTVVLQFPTRTVVVSPSLPEQFVNALRPFMERVA